MKNADIIKTSCKIFGLYFIIQSVVNFREIILYTTGTFIGPDDFQGIYIILGGQIYQAIFNALIALILIFKSDWIAEKLRLGETETINLNFGKADLIELSIIVISGLTILQSFPEILFKLANYIYFNNYDESERQLFWSNKNEGDIFYSIFKFVVGLFCLLNARNFAKRLKRIGDKDDKVTE